jgi:hypothetical protein
MMVHWYSLFSNPSTSKKGLGSNLMECMRNSCQPFVNEFNLGVTNDLSYWVWYCASSQKNKNNEMEWKVEQLTQYEALTTSLCNKYIKLERNVWKQQSFSKLYTTLNNKALYPNWKPTIAFQLQNTKSFKCVNKVLILEEMFTLNNKGIDICALASKP